MAFPACKLAFPTELAVSMAIGATVGILALAFSSTNSFYIQAPPVTLGSPTVADSVLRHAAPVQRLQPQHPTAFKVRASPVNTETAAPETLKGSNYLIASTITAFGALLCIAKSRGWLQAACGAALTVSLAGSASAAALTYDELQSLSYLEVKGSGLANMCPMINEGTGSSLSLQPGRYMVENMCLEPASFQAKLPESEGKATEFEKTKLMTRLTYTLDGIRADLTVGNDGSWKMKEIDGLDYAATTIKLAGGEPVPFLFTVRNFDLTGNNAQLLGPFDVPSYRGSTFMDPRSRGGVTGYDYQQGLQAAGDQEEFAKENLKDLTPSVGTIALKVAKADEGTGEIAGVFESIQPSDNDMGAKQAKLVKASGVWYARISPA